MAECQDWVASHLPVAWIHLHSLDTTFFRLKVNQGILVSILCVVYSPVIYIYIFTGWWFQPLWKILIKWDIVPKIWKNIKCSKAPTSHKWRFLNWGYHKIIQNQTISYWNLWWLWDPPFQNPPNSGNKAVHGHRLIMNTLYSAYWTSMFDSSQLIIDMH